MREIYVMRGGVMAIEGSTGYATPNCRGGHANFSISSYRPYDDIMKEALLRHKAGIGFTLMQAQCQKVPLE